MSSIETPISENMQESKKSSSEGISVSEQSLAGNVELGAGNIEPSQNDSSYHAGSESGESSETPKVGNEQQKNLDVLVAALPAQNEKKKAHNTEKVSQAQVRKQQYPLEKVPEVMSFSIL